MTTNVLKVCVVCGQDVSRQKRTKDKQGLYYCQPCWAAKSGTAVATPNLLPQGLQQIRCSNCGAQVAYDPSRQVVRCAFCNSEYILQQHPPVAAPSIITGDEYCVPATISHLNANTIFSKWIARGFWQPSGLKDLIRQDALSLVYLPYWFFDVTANSTWSGQYSQIHYRPVTRNSAQGSYTRDEPYTIWYPQQGTHCQNYHILVPAHDTLPQKERMELSQVNNNNLDFAAYTPLTPEVFLGANASVPTVSREASEGHCGKSVLANESLACRRLIQRLTSSQSQWFYNRIVFVYYPVWIGAYSFQGKTYRVLIQGRTGTVMGRKPVSWIKVLIAVAIAICLLAIIIGWAAASPQ